MAIDNNYRIYIINTRLYSVYLIILFTILITSCSSDNNLSKKYPGSTYITLNIPDDIYWIMDCINTENIEDLMEDDELSMYKIYIVKNVDKISYRLEYAENTDLDKLMSTIDQASANDPFVKYGLIIDPEIPLRSIYDALMLMNNTRPDYFIVTNNMLWHVNKYSNRYNNNCKYLVNLTEDCRDETVYSKDVKDILKQTINELIKMKKPYNRINDIDLIIILKSTAPYKIVQDILNICTNYNLNVIKIIIQY